MPENIEVMPENTQDSTVGKRAEERLERFIFAARWMLAPAYIVLIGCLGLLTYKTFEEFVQLLLNLSVFAEAKTISQVLTIVDLILIINLVLMVLFVGYTNFVSKIFPAKTVDRQDWMDTLDYSGLKVQLLGSIIAVSSVLILRLVVDLSAGGAVRSEQFVWLAIFHGLFLASILTVAIVNKLKSTYEHLQKKPAASHGLAAQHGNAVGVKA
jgi:uncharacterized protein (TIGR00645 family)